MGLRERETSRRIITIVVVTIVVIVVVVALANDRSGISRRRRTEDEAKIVWGCKIDRDGDRTRLGRNTTATFDCAREYAGLTGNSRREAVTNGFL